MSMVKHLLFNVAFAAWVSVGPTEFAVGTVVAGVPPSFSLSLSEVREKTLSASPELLSLAANVRAVEGAYRQARAIPNPEVAIESEDFGGSKVLDVAPQRTFTIGQSIEWPERRSARIEAARLAHDVAVQDLAKGQRDLLAEVDRRFAAFLGAQERAAIAKQNLLTAGEVTQAVSNLVAAGEASPIEEARAQGDEALAAIDVANAERDVNLARKALARLWGDDTPGFAAAGVLAESVPVPDRDAVLTTLGLLPDLRRWDAEVDRQASLFTLARKQTLPDLSLRVGIRTFSKQSGRSWVAGLALPIPALNQYAGARAEASARLEQAKHDRRAAEVRLRTELLAAHETLARAVSEVQALRDKVLPRAAKVYEALNEGYRRGKLRLLDLLEARRTLAQVRLRYLDALVRLNVASADLNRLTPNNTTNESGDPR